VSFSKTPEKAPHGEGSKYPKGVQLKANFPARG
jgi:hypothetical protein